MGRWLRIAAARGAALLDLVFDPLVARLARAQVSPNAVTVTGSGLALLACPLIVQGYLTAAGWVLGLAAFSDLVDGRLARVTDRASAFGGFLDATLDRLVDGAAFGALSVYFAIQGQPIWVAVSCAALLGAYLTSYTRARAEAQGFDGSAGWYERPHRIVTLCAGLAFGGLQVLLVVLTVLSWWTVCARIAAVWRQALPTPGEER